MFLVRTILILLCFVSVSQAQLQNFLTALTISDSGATVLGNPTGNTNPKSVFFHHATVTDSIMSSLQKYGKQAGNYTSLSAAITDAAGDTATLIVSERHAITTNTTLSGLTAILAQRAAKFNISSGVTLTIQVPFYAGLYQVFEGSGTVNFSTNAVTTVFPEWWGAKNSTSIASAITSIDSGVVFLSPGTWMVPDTVGLKSHVSLIGSGTGTTTLYRADFNKTKKTIVYIGERVNGDGRIDSSITIKNLTIRGNARDNAGYDEFEAGIKIQGGIKIWIENVHIENVGGDGILVEKRSTVNRSIFINNCVIDIPAFAPVADTLVGRNGIAVTGGTDIWIVGNHILDGHNPGGIDIEPTSPDSISNVHILNNIITSKGSNSVGVGIHITSAGATPSKRIFVTGNDVSKYNIGIRTTSPDSAIEIRNNHVHHNTTMGILITGSKNIVVDGNFVYRNLTHGIEITSGQSNIHVSNNRVYYNGGYGIIFSGGTTKNISVTNNIVWNNSQTTDGSKEGILVSATDSTVIGITGGIPQNRSATIGYS